MAYQESVTAAGKPPATPRGPAVQTTAPQYQRPIRRLADLPMGTRGGYSKAWSQDDELESMDDLEREVDEDSRDEDEDDLSNLERDDEVNTDEESLSELAKRSRDIREIRPSINYALRGIAGKKLPERQAVTPTEAYVRPHRTPVEFHWMASNLHHNPLYFEDPSLERYGHSYHPLIQPFASAGRFTTQLVGLPYQMTIDPIHRRRYSLGWIRPGDCAPKLKYRIPLNKKAALVEAAAIATGGLVLP